MKYLHLIFLFLASNSFAQSNSTTNDTVQPKEDLCLRVVVDTNKFTDEIKYRSLNVENISFTKYKSKGQTEQYVSLRIYNSYLAGYDNTGLIILFKSGKKISRANEKIDVNNSSGADWSYSAFFTPSASEINLLKSEEIIGFKLYIFESDVIEGNLIKTDANCVLESPKVPVKKKN